MSIMPHIAIIGAGLIGLSAADSLIARGARVTLIDKRAGPGQGASFCNSGMIHPSQAMPWMMASDCDDEAALAARHVYSLACVSAKLLEARMRALGVKALPTPGCIQIFETPQAAINAQAAYRSLGVPFERRDNSRWAFSRDSLYFPGDRCGNAHAYCAALARDLTAKGARFLYDTASVVLRADGGGVDLRVDNQRLEADHIIVAAGAQSALILQSLGLNLPVRALRGHALNFKRPDIDLPPLPIMHYPTRTALTVFDDHVRLSGTIHEDDPGVLLEIWRTIAPEITLKLGEPIQTWSGERPLCDLGRPIIGSTPVPSLWVNTGHAHMGWTLCAGSGVIMADMILDGMRYERFGWPV